jgi:hypothetical protein
MKEQTCWASVVREASLLCEAARSTSATVAIILFGSPLQIGAATCYSRLEICDHCGRWQRLVSRALFGSYEAAPHHAERF